MKRVLQMLMVSGLLVALSSASFAQGRGRGPGGCRQGWNCPLGLNQTNVTAGCYWLRVNPTDPKQKAFVQEAASLHKQMCAEQIALRALETGSADSKLIEAKKLSLETLRAQFDTLMTNNRELQQQIVQQYGAGSCGGRGAGCLVNCPSGVSAPGCGICPRCPLTP